MGSTVIQPGESGYIWFETHMPPGMGGPHLFSIRVLSNDAVQPEQELTFRAQFGD